MVKGSSSDDEVVLVMRAAAAVLLLLLLLCCCCCLRLMPGILLMIFLVLVPTIEIMYHVIISRVIIMLASFSSKVYDSSLGCVWDDDDREACLLDTIP